ncbi:MAG: lipoprotein [Pseudomonadales bacterium]
MRWIVLCLLAALATTCGQKGPLTLPDDPKVAIGPAAASLHPSHNAL